MKKYIAILILILMTAALFGCASSDRWTTRDTWMQVGVTAVLTTHAYTTSKIQYAPNVHEAGPIAKQFLGSQPTTRDTYVYFGTLIISNYFITRMLPGKWRPYWQGWEMAGHTYAVVNDCNLGLCP